MAPKDIQAAILICLTELERNGASNPTVASVFDEVYKAARQRGKHVQFGNILSQSYALQDMGMIIVVRDHPDDAAQQKRPRQKHISLTAAGRQEAKKLESLQESA